MRGLTGSPLLGRCYARQKFRLPNKVSIIDWLENGRASLVLFAHFPAATLPMATSTLQAAWPHPLNNQSVEQSVSHSSACMHACNDCAPYSLLHCVARSTCITLRREWPADGISFWWRQNYLRMLSTGETGIQYVVQCTLADACSYCNFTADDGPCLGWRPDSKSGYQWMTYGEVNECIFF